MQFRHVNLHRVEVVKVVSPPPYILLLGINYETRLFTIDIIILGVLYIGIVLTIVNVMVYSYIEVGYQLLFFTLVDQHSK